MAFSNQPCFSEFTLAEIVHFTDTNKDHAKIDSVGEILVNLCPAIENAVTCTIADAVDKKLFDNQTFAYFVGRIQLFFTKIGVPADSLRFYQSSRMDLALSTTDRWQCQILLSEGWKDCVRIVDNYCYYVHVYSRVSSNFADRTVEKVSLMPNRAEICQKYEEAEAAVLLDCLSSLSEPIIIEMQTELETKGVFVLETAGFKYSIDASMISFSLQTEHVPGASVFQSTIELSFSFSAILYCLLEVSFYSRSDDSEQMVLRLPSFLCPVQCCVLPLLHCKLSKDLLRLVTTSLRQAGISCKVDDSLTAIGKRFRRCDELGVAFTITVDWQTVEEYSSNHLDGTVTIRARDSRKQIRVSINQLISTLIGLLLQENEIDCL